MAELIVLGSGSGFGTQERFCTSIALLVEDQTYLLDCGEPAAVSLFKTGVDPLSIRTIFISHLHPDHVGGLASVLFSMYLPGRDATKKFKPWSITRYDAWYRNAIRFPDTVPGEGATTEVNLFLPSEGIQGITGYLKTVYLDPALLPFDLNISPVQVGIFYEDEHIQAAAAPNRHLENNFRYQEYVKTHADRLLQSYSFSVDVEEKKIVFSGDIDNLEELVPLMDNADILLLEIAHFDPEDIKPFVDRFSLEHVILTHIHPGLEQRIHNLVNQWGDPKIKISHDFYSIKL